MKYTYSGKELDEENGLYYFNARYYDAEVGRFISVDPAQDGWNWYVYANNNPLNMIDPTGLSTVSNLTPTLEAMKKNSQEKTSKPCTIGPAPKEMNNTYALDLSPGNQNSAIGWDPDAPFKFLNREASACWKNGVYINPSILEYKDKVLNVEIISGDAGIRWALPGYKQGNDGGKMDTSAGIKISSEFDLARGSVKIPLGLFDLSLSAQYGLGGKLQLGYVPGSDSFFKASIAFGPGLGVGLAPPSNKL